MLFEQYDPQEDKLFQVMDNDGHIINPDWKPDISDQTVEESYRLMQYARTADLQIVSYQRQGRMYTYPPNLGQEAISCAVGKQLRKEDWLVTAFREMCAWLLKGGRIRDIFLYWGGYEEGSTYSGAPNILPVAIPIGSQLLHAVGIAYALKYRGEDSVAFGFTGDGGTSEGDFHEALNFAAVWKVPVVFVIQNNQYAISVPVSKQTISKNLAIKAVAYNMPGIKVDGNDFFAVYRAAQEAIKRARSGQGPVLIEAVTYRRGAHTTSDDPGLYRTEKEEKEWEVKDPLKRLGAYLTAQGLRKEEEDEKYIAQYKKEIEKEFAIYEKHPPYPLEDVFKYQYRDMPDDLKQQQAAYENYLKWKEAGQ